MPINPTTSFIEPFGMQIDLAQGIMLHPNEHVVRHAAEMRGYYADEEALEQLIASRDSPPPGRVCRLQLLGAGHPTMTPDKGITS